MDLTEITSSFPSSSLEYLMLKSVVDFVDSQMFVILIAFLKTVSFLVTAFLLGLIVFIYIKTNVVGEKIKKIKTLVSNNPIGSGKRLAKRFERIKLKLKKNLVDEDKQAVIDADLAFQSALANLGLNDKSFLELAAQKTLWHALEPKKLIQAREVRNRAVHFSESLTHNEALEAVESFEKALKDLGFL
ncbi:MAG: hypothetical protein UX26_C0015G0012 [Parcubacteria group bacterium GW2011_GWC1_45_9]|nr:MAG: hypothetical protein UW85_C0002G0016 [Parcubacteria group bacterium GW2011_GWA1_Parcubacteria_45_10]KKT88204.1 MAG: hypothetical protein UW89_C0010G0015 [Parcubacteria group bacterium GW2011_GWB1_45_10]KKU16839.1 MAG: hypothetical protein UX26_C0015G0012 [Parcubacteria group bacterium GW2011_GWC1_45_9]HCI05570.1 hypothetical protein [Patescibacteria group bacterium]